MESRCIKSDLPIWPQMTSFQKGRCSTQFLFKSVVSRAASSIQAKDEGKIKGIIEKAT